MNGNQETSTPKVTYNPLSAVGIPTVITAGGRIHGELAEVAQTEIKAFIPLGGRTLLDRSLKALRDSGRVGQMAIVGPLDELREANTGVDLLVGEGESGPENVERGLDAILEAAGDGMVLLCASDLAFLDDGAIRWILDYSPTDCDIVFPVITKTDSERVFPGLPRVWTRIAGDDYTGGSVLLVRPSAIKKNRALIERVFAARKSQLAMAQLLGLPFVVRFKMGTLTIAAAEKRVSELTGCRCHALVGADPRLAFDIDDNTEYEWAQRYLRDGLT